VALRANSRSVNTNDKGTMGCVVGGWPTIAIVVVGLLIAMAGLSLSPFALHLKALADSNSVANNQWSGYAATGRQFTRVSGSWTVPTAVCPSGSMSSSASWIGIGGTDGGSTVEQTGTDSACKDGVPYYYVWFELYGTTYLGGLPVVSCIISSSLQPCVPHSALPGDVMSGEVNVLGGTWTFRLTDVSQRWSYSLGVSRPLSSVTHAPPAETSAEWIVERDDSTLADFGSVTFSGAMAVGDGRAEAASELDPTRLTLANDDGVTITDVSALGAAGNSFTDAWQRGK
jgi:hypothetical protein